MKEKIKNFVLIFFSVYFILYIFPFPLPSFAFFNFCDDIIIWFGKTVLNIGPIEKVVMTGSGDTTFDYVKFFFLLILSIVISMFLSLSIKKTEKKSKLILYSISYAKYFLAFNMLSYGLAKLDFGQFPSPSLIRLDEKVGDMSPMGLLWTFMGYSLTYSTFSALCEIIAGVFLFFRKTNVLGSILSFAIMLNVVLLNFSYDVPVKLFSIHLVVIAIFIVHQNLYSLFSFFIGKPSQISYNKIELKSKWLKIGKYVFILMIISMAFVPFCYKITTSASVENLNAVYTNESFMINKDSINTNYSFSKIIIDNKTAIIYSTKDSILHYNIEIKPQKHEIDFKSQITSHSDFKLNYNQRRNGKLELYGKINSDSIYGKYIGKRKEDFELIKRKFNWISEFPYNR